MNQKTIKDIQTKLLEDLIELQFPGQLMVGDICVTFSDNMVENIMQEWVEGWLQKNGIDYALNDNTQMPPDFYLNPDNKKEGLMEIKAFTGSPNFDVAAFRSFINLVIEKPWKLHSKHLLIKYKMENGIVTVEQFWLKNLWEICSTSSAWPVKVQYKNKVIVNIRPSVWYSDRADFSPFDSLEDFLAAIEETIYQYPDTRTTIALHWKEKLKKSYENHYGCELNIPRWYDIKDKYVKER